MAPAAAQPPIILGIVLGPLVESTFITSMIVWDGSLRGFISGTGGGRAGHPNTTSTMRAGLFLATFEDGHLVYRGGVGTGFPDKMRREVWEVLQLMVRIACRG